MHNIVANIHLCVIIDQDPGKKFYYGLFDSLLRVMEKRVVNFAGRL